MGKLTKGVLLFIDNAPDHKVHKVGIDIWNHKLYSPGLAPNDYYVFTKMKKEHYEVKEAVLTLSKIKRKHLFYWRPR